MKSNNNFHILIVDDEKFNIELAAVYLKEEGYKLSFALNAKGALESVLRSEVDLILLDINMPTHDGFSVCKMLKEDPKTKDIPIIFLTAQTDIEYISKAFEVGGIDYITKPFNGVELKIRVKTHLQNLAYLQEIKHKQSKLAQISITDSLTKLYNSLYFDSQLKSYQTKGKKFWFVYIKINRFEKVNALYGFATANKIIRLFSKVLQKAAPTNAVVAKLHGVSFAILLKDYDIKVMHDLYETINELIAKEKTLANALSISMVFRNVKDPSESIASLYKNAQASIDRINSNGEKYLFQN
jgi:diguanylate cyclase (GGDEF)-like protein